MHRRVAVCKRLAAGFLVLALASTGGCDENDRGSSGNSSMPGSTPDAGGACVGTIAEVESAAGHPVSVPSACPPTYGNAMQNPVSCGGTYPRIAVGTCGPALVMSSNCGLHGFVCVYDATSLALVGAATFTDTPTYCGRTSSCIAGGMVPAEISCATDGLRLSCDFGVPDGGLPDGVPDGGPPTDDGLL